jgi:serine/threonine protein kinase
MDTAELSLQVLDLHVLGAGSQGTVILATLPEVGRVAVKAFGGCDRYTDFASECRILQAVGEHPGVVRCIRVMPTLPGIALEPVVVPGSTTTSTLLGALQLNALTRSQVKQVLVDVARGLAHVHARGYVHQDVKLENILVDMGDGRDPGGAPRGLVCDFGCAIHVDAAPRPKMYGTLGYQAPEQFVPTVDRMYATSPATDVWGFGVVMLEALSLVSDDLFLVPLAVEEVLHSTQRWVVSALKDWTAQSEVELEGIRARAARSLRCAMMRHFGGADHPCWDLAARCFMDAPGDRCTMAEVADALWVSEV